MTFSTGSQVYPQKLTEWVNDQSSEKGRRAMHAMLRMKKIDMRAIERAYEGT